MAMLVNVDLQLASDLEGLPDEEQICRWVNAAVESANTPGGDAYELAVRLVDEDESQSLNNRYRQQDRPTNVLSFPFDGLEGLPATAVHPLGDLVICAPVVAAEAGQQGKACHQHWAHIVIHGTLHLLGYDHQNEQQAASMEALEESILQDFGIENPYREN